MSVNHDGHYAGTSPAPRRRAAALVLERLVPGADYARGAAGPREAPQRGNVAYAQVRQLAESLGVIFDLRVEIRTLNWLSCSIARPRCSMQPTRAVWSGSARGECVQPARHRRPGRGRAGNRDPWGQRAPRPSRHESARRFDRGVLDDPAYARSLGESGAAFAGSARRSRLRTIGWRRCSSSLRNSQYAVIRPYCALVRGRANLRIRLTWI